MVKSLNIAQLTTSDGLAPIVIRKINDNFNNLARYVDNTTGASSASSEAIRLANATIVQLMQQVAQLNASVEGMNEIVSDLGDRVAGLEEAPSQSFGYINVDVTEEKSFTIDVGQVSYAITASLSEGTWENVGIKVANNPSGFCSVTVFPMVPGEEMVAKGSIGWIAISKR